MSIFNHFQHLTLTSDQERALTKLEAFLDSPVQVFVLKGYAGSGKTTILKGLVEYLSSSEKKFVLMAPTGRAAKVIREKTGQEANTVHKSIYGLDDFVEVENGDSFCYVYKIRNNIDVANTIFIIDEASMVSDAETKGEFFQFGSGKLLTDLIEYTRVGMGKANSKIIFIGDPCQLPPIGDDSSKAFDSIYLKEKYGLMSEETEMKEVKRQDSNSGILNAAAKIRKSITSGFYKDFNLKGNNIDIFNPPYGNFLDKWGGVSGTKIIIAYKNRTCLQLNNQIREIRFGKTGLPPQKGDIIILGANNYVKNVFNGEFAVVNDIGVSSISRTILLRGKPPITLSWRNIELVFPDANGNNRIVAGKTLENFLNGDNTLRPEEWQALYVDFTNRHQGLKRKTKEFQEAIFHDEFFNCLLIKYGYAVTCHKAQGGEWDNVFTIWDHDNSEAFDCFTDKQRRAGKTNQDFYRWAYTAITRASKTLFALNPPSFDSYSAMAFLDVPVLNALNELTGNQAEVEEINLDNELFQELSELNLLEQPFQLQDHYIRVRQAVRKQFIEVVGWEKVGYEIRYTFMRGQDKAVFRTYVNGQNVFGNPLTSMPKFSLNSEFNDSIVEIVKQLPKISIKRNTAETIFNQIEFEFELEEEFPFTKCLFDDLVLLFKKTDIKIDNIEHQQYRERYTFKRNQEVAVLDFEYNGSGFFGRIVPLSNLTNSSSLIIDIRVALQTFKQEEHAG